MKYRKKPVVITAKQVPTNRHTQDGLLAFGELSMWMAMHGCPFQIVNAPDDQCAVDIKTLEGTMRADPGDFIIRGIKGEFYPCKPDIFAATYEAVS